MREKGTSVKKLNEIPDNALEALARCLYPAICSYFESEDGQREFVEWQARQDIEIQNSVGEVGSELYTAA